MKKIFLFVAVVSAFSFASCKKDRVCTCTEDGYTSVVTYTKARKGDARSQCLSYSWVDAGVTKTRTCSLK